VSFEIVSITMKRMNELIFGVSGILHSIVWNYESLLLSMLS
jgi:hypothetical protein